MIEAIKLLWDGPMEQGHLEYLRYWVLVAHLFAVIMAYGSVIHADIRVLFGKIDCLTLKMTHHIVTFGLVILYLTGISIVLIDYGHIPLYPEILNYPKLCIKLIAVLTLTINGIFLDRYVFKRVQGKEYVSKRRSTIFAISGGISMASWMFATFAGTAKILVPMLHLHGFAEVYVTMLVVFVSAAVVFNKIYPINYKGFRKADM